MISQHTFQICGIILMKCDSIVLAMYIKQWSSVVASCVVTVQRSSELCSSGGEVLVMLSTEGQGSTCRCPSRRAGLDSLLRRVRGCDIDKWNYGDCIDSIYEFAELVNNIVEKNSNLDVQSVFVFPCGINDKPKAYVARNSDGSCTVSMIVPYYK